MAHIFMLTTRPANLHHSAGHYLDAGDSFIRATADMDIYLDMRLWERGIYIGTRDGYAMLACLQDFIAHARGDIPLLLEIVDGLRAQSRTTLVPASSACDDRGATPYPWSPDMLLAMRNRCDATLSLPWLAVVDERGLGPAGESFVKMAAGTNEEADVFLLFQSVAGNIDTQSAAGREMLDRHVEFIASSRQDIQYLLDSVDSWQMGFWGTEMAPTGK